MVIPISDSKINVKFVVTKLRFRNEDTGFAVSEVKIKKYSGASIPTTEPVFKGNFPSVNVGDEFDGEGQWLRDPRYGDIFKLDWATRIAPNSFKQIADFVSRVGVDIGEKKAEKIVEVFGMDTLSIIGSEEDWRKIAEIKGFGETTALALHTALVRCKGYEDIISFVLSIGGGYRDALQTYDTYKDNAVQTIRENPYSLSYSTNLGFATVDMFANKLGFSFDNSERLKAGILDYLDDDSQDKGDIFAYKTSITNGLNKYLADNGAYGRGGRIQLAAIEEAISELKRKGEVVTDTDDSGNECVYLTKYYFAEERIVKRLVKLIHDPKPDIYPNFDACLDSVLGVYKDVRSIELAEQQQNAVRMAIKNSVCILTGGPGTGKTQTVNAIIDCVKAFKPDARIHLCAPTGKAARRMSEITGMEAHTIHKLLGLNNVESGQEVEKLSGDFLIVDESSMIDVYVFDKLLESIDDNMRLLLVGDYEQLPSVGPGLILRDLINSGVIPVTTLTEIFRQGKESQIISNSHRVLAAKKTTDVNGLSFDNTENDFYFIQQEDKFMIRLTILESIKRFIDNYGYSLSDIQVLSPIKKGDLGVSELNRAIQRKFNPLKPGGYELRVGCTTFRSGDKVIQTKNNYDIGVFNGEIGVIKNFFYDENGERCFTVDFGDKEISYDRRSAGELDLAYAITIHKAQGSEFPIVIMAMHSSQKNWFNKNLVYTAWTRAKERVVVVGQKEVLDEAVIKSDNIARNTRIKEKLVKQVKDRS